MADLTTTPADVDGVELPPPAVPNGVKTPAASENPGGPPVKLVQAGGAPAPVNRPEDAIPAQVEATYAARGQQTTGATYAMHQRRLLAWLQANGLRFDTMPSGAFDKFLDENVSNPVTRNAWIVSLRVMQDTARAMNIKFLEQTLTKKAKPPKPPKAEPAANATVEAGPTPGPTTPTVPPPMFALPSDPAPAPATVARPLAAAPAAPAPQPVSAFPSLGKRIKVSRISDGRQGPGIPVGIEIPIGVYQREMIEQYGTHDNFLMTIVRPAHGPFAGEPPVVYRLQMLDNAMKPLTGHQWDAVIAADPSAGPPPPHAQHNTHAPVHAPTPMHPPVAPKGAAPNPEEAWAKIVDRAMQQLEREQEDYERKRKELEDKARKGEMDQMQLFFMMSQLQQPKPINFDELSRKLREEMKMVNAELQPPAPAASPQQLAALFDEPKRPDPVVEKLMEANAQLQQQVLALAQKQPEKTDSLGDMEKLLMLAKALAPAPPPPNPLMEQLAALSLRQITEPQKPKTLADLITEMKALKEAGAILGGGGEPSGPSLGEALLETIGIVVENADKIGAALGAMRGGAVKAAFAKNRAAKQPLANQLPAGQPQQPQQPQPFRVSDTTAQLFVAMVDTVKAWKTVEEDDEKVFEAVIAVLEALRKEPDPRGMQITDAVMKVFNNANTVIELKQIVLKLFQFCGAQKLLTSAIVEGLGDMLARNYSAIYGLLNGGAERVLPELAEQQAAQPVQSAAEVGEAQAAAEADAPEEGDEEGDEEEEEEEGAATA